MDNDLIITATIWTDSVEVNGNDSVFYLNRIMCDTCVTIIGGPNSCDTCYAAINRPQFFQRSVSVFSNGAVNFRDTGNLMLMTLANVSDTWLFDSSWNVSATVTSIGMDSIFGSFDSIKTILLTTGDTIILSQNFGVLQFPHGYGTNSYYRLAGIEGRNLGEQVPKFADFFDFDVGDMFEYKIADYTMECHPKDVIFKYTITNRLVNGNVYDFAVDGIKLLHDWMLWNPSCAPHDYYWTELFSNYHIVFIDSATHVTNKFNREYFILNYQIPELDIPCFGNYDSIYDRIRMFPDSNNLLQKSFGISGLPDVNNQSYYFYLNYLTDTLNPSGLNIAWQSHSLIYTVGLGVTAKSYSSCFEPSYEEHLTAYRKNGDTVGVFTPDSILLMGLKQEQFKDDVLISPNPATSILLISHLPHKLMEISLTDIQGKTLLKKTAEDFQVELDINDVESGLYFITIKSSAGIFSKKVLIQH